MCETKRAIYDFLKDNNTCYYVNDIYMAILLSQEKPKIKLGKRKSGLMLTSIIFLLSIIIFGILFIINLLFKQRYNYDEKIAIARVPSERYKIARIHDTIQFIEDDIRNFNFSVFRIGSRWERISFLIRHYFRFCINDFNKIKDIFENVYLSSYSRPIFLRFAIRIPHTIIFKYAIENVMKNYTLSTIYVGAMYDRFAFIIDALARKYEKEIVCIPHGIESTEKIPAGFIGDIFYCSSMEMASKLNDLYGTSKFLFDENITKQMYRFKKIARQNKVSNIKKVVFFTQPINDIRIKKVLNLIAQYLKNKNQKLYIKLHPNDNSRDFVIHNSEFIDDLGEAIIGNLCISIYSTVLLEAVYNESTPISIVFLINDTNELKGIYEMLNDTRILKPKDEVSLFEMIENYYK